MSHKKNTPFCKRKLSLSIGSGLACATLMLPPVIANAQTQDEAGNRRYLEEIVITARKRAETLHSVPVVATAIGGTELKNRAIIDMDGIARLVPQLMIGPQSGSIQGGNISLRGLQGPDSSPFADQAVSFNVDGVAISKATVRRMSEVDIEQIEVLKGPQALFFGKNSPAGIISIRTADPGDSFEAKITTGYEFEAREKRVDGFISSPFSDTIGFRLAGVYSEMDGYFNDITPAGLVVTPSSRKSPQVDHDYSLRGTLVWEPNEDFSARLKLNHGSVENNGPGSTTMYVSCPGGSRQSGGGNCGAENKNVNASSGPVVGTIPSTFNFFGSDGENFLEQDQSLGSVELNYNLSEAIQLTSVTGYYDVDTELCQNFQNDYVFVLPNCTLFKTKEYSQEFRIQSNYEGAWNFVAGALYGETKAERGTLTYLYSPFFDLLGPAGGGLDTPVMVNNYFLKQDGRSYSAFLQMIYEPTEAIEIAFGGRYSYEEKKLPLVQSNPGLSEGNFSGDPILGAHSLVVPLSDKEDWTDFSPEVTIAWRPTDDLTFFGAYKQGFLSGGFNGGSSSFAGTPDLGYDQQTIEGVEFGVKARFLDRSLNVNAAIYRYEVEDLQVTSFVDATGLIRNAGSVETHGAEVDLTYLTPIEGLIIRGAAAYNKGKYDSFKNAPCYVGQTPALGCNIVNGIAQQDLSGTELIRAPEWDLAGGISYEMHLGANLILNTAVDFTHSSSYLTDLSSAPASRMPHYTLVDASLRLSDASDKWAIALVGRNLEDKLYWVASPGAPFTGSGQGIDNAVIGDRFASVSRGREILLQLSYNF